MENQSTIRWKAFKEVLSANSEKHLQFQYAENSFVDAAFHITEIKKAPITSVDCGGKVNNWTEVIVQLWEPSVKDTERSMLAEKALSIIKIVENVIKIDEEAIVKIEFGNSVFDTRQMYPSDFMVQDDSFTVKLSPDHTQCKAIGRGESCGTSADDCCADESAAKPVVKLKNLAVSSCCGTDCCN